MDSLAKGFDELRQRIRHGRRIDCAGDDPVYYLVFDPRLMLAVKKRTKAWKAKLELEGWKVHVFSMADAANEILTNHPYRELWLLSEKDDPLDFESVAQTLTDALTAKDALKAMLEEKLQSLAGEEQSVLFVTDLEALHPYLRVGAIEQRLQGKFAAPAIILYPGKRKGRTNLKFLGIYPEDGNYRSIHIGE